MAAEHGVLQEQDLRDERQRERDQHRIGDEGQDVAPLDRRLDLLAEIEGDEVAGAEPR